MGKCNEGYKGFMCGQCEYKYYKLLWYSCEKCSDLDFELTQALLRLIVIVISIYVMCYFTIEYSTSHNENLIRFQGVIKQVFNHCVCLRFIL